MLANLDNEVIFKKAFTDVEVFEGFVKDIVGIEIKVGKIETEKRFDQKISFIDFKYDIFAETKDKRTIIEIQKVDYDYNFDRFLLYHMMGIAELQRKAKEYKIQKKVYTIVVITQKYVETNDTGEVIEEPVLQMPMFLRDLEGVAHNIFGHRLIFLNPNYKRDTVPLPYKDWLDLIYESIHNAEAPNLNEANRAVKKAAEIIEYQNLTPTELTIAKDREQARNAKIAFERFYKKEGRKEGRTITQIQNALNAHQLGLPLASIAQIVDLSIEEVQAIIEAQGQ